MKSNVITRLACGDVFVPRSDPEHDVHAAGLAVVAERG